MGIKNQLALVLSVFTLGLALVIFQNCGKKGGTRQNDTATSLSERGLTLNENLSVSVLKVEPSLSGGSCDIFITSKHPEGKIGFVLYVDGINAGTVSWGNGDVVPANTAAGILPCSDFADFKEPASGAIQIQLELIFNDLESSTQSVAQSYTPGPGVPTLLSGLAVKTKYRHLGHTVYLYEDYSHCKYPKVRNEEGTDPSKEVFDAILAHDSGGVCNGDYNGTGTEPTDWTYVDLQKLSGVAIGTKYRYMGHTVYLYSDYSHCKYPKALDESGTEPTKEIFDAILEYRSGGVCDGEYNGTGSEPGDWTYTP